MRALILPLMMGGLMAMDAEDAQAMRDAIATVEAQMEQAGGPQGLPSPEALAEQVSAEEQRKLLAAIAEARRAQAGGATQAEALRLQLEQMTAATLGRDAIDEVRAQVAGLARSSDPHPSQIYQEAPMGLLWIFWATDAPGTELLPGQLARVGKAFPELVIHDQHLMRLSDWQRMLKTLANLQDVLASNDPLVDDESEGRAKQQVRDAVAPRYLAATAMAETRRNGGYLIIEDLRPAYAWSVSELPSAVYVSPRGIVHRLRGLNPERDLAAWIVRCVQWEQENDGTLRVREAQVGRKDSE